MYGEDENDILVRLQDLLLLVKELLNKEYEYVFTLDTYDYSTQLKTNKYDINSYNLDDISAQKFTKSRYLPVSHENLVEYIIKNKETKL